MSPQEGWAAWLRGCMPSKRQLLVAVLIGIGWGLLDLATGCGTLSSNTVKTAEQLAEEACLTYAQAHPDQPIIDDGCQVFSDIINLVMAKPTPAAAKEALAAHPPLSIAAPCIDLKNPYPREGE